MAWCEIRGENESFARDALDDMDIPVYAENIRSVINSTAETALRVCWSRVPVARTAAGTAPLPISAR
jgi:hypothetical protein